jgi:hypothetical protein
MKKYRGKCRSPYGKWLLNRQYNEGLAERERMGHCTVHWRELWILCLAHAIRHVLEKKVGGGSRVNTVCISSEMSQVV